MDSKKSGVDIGKQAEETLGYLNFSSGAADPRFLNNINELFTATAGNGDRPAWKSLKELLLAQLASLKQSSDAFRHCEQAEAVLRLVFDEALPAYREFHADLLFHLSDEELYQPLFIGRVCEAVLQQGPPWDETGRIVNGAVHQLNDYLGHRPVAVLRTEQKIQPYSHERVRPIPLWIQGAGMAFGPYQELIKTALAILDATAPAILFDAMFAMDQLDELAVDPRAYDFDHPVNKRPNYIFGQWDLAKLDNAGRSRRFVLQQVTLEAMLDRIQHHGRLSRKQVLFEEAAVLAGTMLMGSGISGNRPDAHDSTVTLATLVQKIAVYRDAFYEQLLVKMQGSHGDRLRAEALALRQPFGGARQHFNHYLARRRASQLEHVHLAQTFAAIGYTDAAHRQVAVVPVASARMTCEIRCRMATAHLAVERGQLAEAAAELPQIEDLLHRAIRCGAIVDPWNILGFGGEYSLFPAVENSVHDHRVDDLLDLMSDVFTLYVRIHKSAAAAGESELQQTLTESLGKLARWWDKFAVVEVNSVEGISGQATLESAESVAAALRAWHKAGAAAGDLAFWRRHVEHFRSAKAYALVIDTLLDHRDFVAAMALIVQWLSQAAEIPLVEEDYSFHDLALVWMEELWQHDGTAEVKGLPIAPASQAGETTNVRRPAPALPQAERWPLARKFLDFLEANADEDWQVPRFEMAIELLGNGGRHEGDEDFDGDDEEEPEEDDLFSAAYEQVTYRDSTDDGIEGELSEGGQSPTDFELVGEAERIVSRLNFLSTVAQLWKLAATASISRGDDERDEVLAGWLKQATQNHKQLLDLLSSVYRHRIAPPRGTQESLVEYDRRRSVKETLCDEIIQTTVETADAARMIRAAMKNPVPVTDVEEWELPACEALTALLHGDIQRVRQVFPALLEALSKQPLLYIALARGGNPLRIVASRGRQYVLRRLLNYLPRQGLLVEACQLLETAQRMETSHPVGPGAITEFDNIFEVGCQAITECLVLSSNEWHNGDKKASVRRADGELIEALEQTVEILLRSWLRHSRGVRLSVLETVNDGQAWDRLKQFIETYGSDLFTQRFLNLGNLRGILHQGVEEYLEILRDEPDAEEQFRLIDDLDKTISVKQAAQWLDIAIEAVVENYAEYIDYNSITTQSDRGELLYTLLDFLRLRANYDRLAWNLRPVLLAHQTLVGCGRDRAAEIWRRAIAKRTGPMADEHLARFERLCKKYGMRLPSIADHLSERFVRPLEIDRLCSLVRPAIDEIRNSRPPEALKLLEQQVEQFMREPSGAGFELPGWLAALDQELEQAQWQASLGGGDEDDASFDAQVHMPQVLLSREEVAEQLTKLQAKG